MLRAVGYVLAPNSDPFRPCGGGFHLPYPKDRRRYTGDLEHQCAFLILLKEKCACLSGRYSTHIAACMLSRKDDLVTTATFLIEGRKTASGLWFQSCCADWSPDQLMLHPRGLVVSPTGTSVVEVTSRSQLQAMTPSPSTFHSIALLSPFFALRFSLRFLLRSSAS